MTISGTVSADKLYDTQGNDEIRALGGNDTVNSLYGVDTIYGGDGNDSIFIYYQATGGTIYGEAGDDALYGQAGSNLLVDGGAGNDQVNASGTVTSAKLYGGDGNDTVYASSGSDLLLEGGAGDDQVNTFGNATNARLYGGDGKDSVFVASGTDNFLDGGSGNDSLSSFDKATRSTLLGGDGDDTLSVSSGTGNLLSGGAGNDSLFGSAASDLLLGDAGDDSLFGGAGNDTLDGGAGNNLLLGGDGDDTYLIRSLYDTIQDNSGHNKGTIYVDFYKAAPGIDWTWAPGVQKLPYWIDDVTFGDATSYPGLVATKKTFYFAFPAAAPGYFSGEDLTTFQPFNDKQKAFARAALAYISSVVDLQFIETTATDAANTFVFSNSDQSFSSGHGAPPSGSFVGSDVALDSSSENLSPADGAYSALTLIHEIGHALGLKHTFAHADAGGDVGEGPYLPAAEESTAWSVMSYTSAPANYHLAYSPFDIAALQYLYGPSRQRTADDTYRLSATATNMVWDGGGTDTLDGSALSQPETLYLTPGYQGYIGQKNNLISAAGQVTINFGTVIENALGGSANDRIVGNAADNRLQGNAGNDILAGAAGNDFLDGGTGTDMAAFTGARADYGIERTATGLRVTDAKGGDGTDTLAGIERLQFADKALAFDTAGTAGQVYRLYQAAFNRKPDMAGLGWQIRAADNGMPLLQLSQNFMSSAEFVSLYGASPSTSTLVKLFYNNVLHRAPAQTETDFWVNIIDTRQQTRAEVLTSFSESPENQAQLIGAIQNGIEYQYYA